MTITKVLTKAGVEVKDGKIKKDDLDKAVSVLAKTEAALDEIGGYTTLIYEAGLTLGMKLQIMSSKGSTLRKPFKERYEVHTPDAGPFYVILSVDPEEADDTDPSVFVEIEDKHNILGKKNAKNLTAAILEMIDRWSDIDP